jgi:hypothetical protein
VLLAEVGMLKLSAEEFFVVVRGRDGDEVEVELIWSLLSVSPEFFNLRSFRRITKLEKSSLKNMVPASAVEYQLRASRSDQTRGLRATLTGG